MEKQTEKPLTVSEIITALAEDLNTKLNSFTVARTADGLNFVCVTRTNAIQKTYNFPEPTIGRLREQRGHYLIYNVTGDILDKLIPKKPKKAKASSKKAKKQEGDKA